jgi:peroxiredoxin
MFATAMPRAVVPTLLLLGLAFVPTQSQERGEWQLAPRLLRGQELVYRGVLREQSQGRGVQFHKVWKLEIRCLVYDAKPNGAVDVAFLTRLTPQHPTGEKREKEEAAFVRLDTAEIDPQGRLTASASANHSIALDGITTWEHGFILEAPRTALPANQDWLVTERDRPARKYRIIGAESVASTACVKVTCVQQSDDWDKPRADSTAWRRRDTLFITPRLGVAQKVVRDLERREPAHRDSTYRLVAEYELDSSWRFDGNLLDDRKREVTQIRTFQDSLQALLPPAKTASKEAFESLLARIDFHVDKHPATPYREALTRLRARTADLAQNPHRAEPVAFVKHERLSVGKAAPEFVVDDLQTKKSVSLRAWQGKRLLMVFYQPASDASAVVLRHVQRLADEKNDAELVVLGFSMSDDSEAVKRVEAMLGLTFPSLAGGSLRQSYDVEATPRIVLVDGEGVVRAAFTGWGPETPAELEAVLRKCQANGKPQK